ncbi:hypothetical protein FEM48_Zijuj02G0186000 [Ziziphus jujuba var. spinosa]|uniref:Uncharacterized protein n=1 Tax=Ziziphus jujuba var. spinosa TaxID=714518 RepID=A0A978VXB0_ZIZJJ|nr:hypothetical protein FEM48_Zijuj02G0186000 [Ziziphus jujuba var. spinosa]
MVSASKILCIDLNNVVPQTPTQIELPSRKIEIDVRVPGIDPLRLTTDRSDMCPVGCFGVSMNHLYYCRRESGAFCVWFYNDDNDNGATTLKPNDSNLCTEDNRRKHGILILLLLLVSSLSFCYALAYYNFAISFCYALAPEGGEILSTDTASFTQINGEDQVNNRAA